VAYLHAGLLGVVSCGLLGALYSLFGGEARNVSGQPGLPGAAVLDLGTAMTGLGAGVLGLGAAGMVVALAAAGLAEAGLAPLPAGQDLGSWVGLWLRAALGFSVVVLGGVVLAGSSLAAALARSGPAGVMAQPPASR